jgi:hypothetical protein
MTCTLSVTKVTRFLRSFFGGFFTDSDKEFFEGVVYEIASQEGRASNNRADSGTSMGVLPARSCTL